jgi:hypothetical protein
VPLPASFVVAALAGCGEPGPRRRPAPPPPPATDPSRGLAYLRGASAVVRESVAGPERVLAGPEQVPTALAWAPDGAAVYVAAGLEVWREPADGGAPSRLAAVRDEANDALVRLDARVDGRGLVAMTARTAGPERLSDRRYWEIDTPSGAVRETSARGADALGGRRPRVTSGFADAVVSPTGRWELRVAPATVRGPAERVVIGPKGGEGREVVNLAALPRRESGGYTGVVDDAGWAAGADTALFVAETGCDEVCAGALFAVEPDGSNLRRIASSVEEVPREWNGTAVVFADSGTVVVCDVSTGERVELGPGAAPAWRPGRP